MVYSQNSKEISRKICIVDSAIVLPIRLKKMPPEAIFTGATPNVFVFASWLEGYGVLFNNGSEFGLVVVGKLIFLIFLEEL